MEIANRKVAYQGTDFTWIIAFYVSESDPVEFLDLTGFHFYMQIRNEADELLASATCTIVTHPKTEEAHKAARIFIGHATTLLMPRGSHRFNVLFDDPAGVRSQLTAGEFYIYPSVTVVT